MDALTAFLRADAARPFVWGVRDCGLRLADWVLAARGIDPAADVRGTYSNAEELAVIMGWGGLPRFVDRLARRAGLQRVNEARRGDIAVVSVGGGAPQGAIRLRVGWSINSDGGIGRALSVRCICAWNVLECLRPLVR